MKIFFDQLIFFFWWSVEICLLARFSMHPILSYVLKHTQRFEESYFRRIEFQYLFFFNKQLYRRTLLMCFLWIFFRLSESFILADWKARSGVKGQPPSPTLYNKGYPKQKHNKLTSLAASNVFSIRLLLTLPPLRKIVTRKHFNCARGGGGEGGGERGLNYYLGDE